jgi:hypothetical protein
MKTFYRIFLCLLGLSFSVIADGQEMLARESFENPAGDFGYFTNGGGSCDKANSIQDFLFRVTSTQDCFGTDLQSGADGNAWFEGEDIDGATGGEEGHITLQPIDVKNYYDLKVTLAIAVSNDNDMRWEYTDNIYIDYNMDNTGWITTGLFKGDGEYGGHLRIDTDKRADTYGPYNETVPMQFTDYSFPIPETGTSMQVRVRLDVNGGTEEIGVDNIRVTGFLSALPIVLKDFEASVQQNNDVILNWNTASEINSDKFEIEYSIDGNNFDYVGEVEALGNSSIGNHYSFIHNEPIEGSSYYRLKLVDRDGTFVYSPIRHIVIDVHPQHELLIYPNPVISSGIISLQFNAEGDSNMQGEILSLTGERLFSLVIINNTIQLPNELPNGMYFLMVNVRSNQLKGKFLVLN